MREGGRQLVLALRQRHGGQQQQQQQNQHSRKTQNKVCSYSPAPSASASSDQLVHNQTEKRRLSPTYAKCCWQSFIFPMKKAKKTWQYINPNSNPEPGRWGVEDGSFNEMGTKLWTCYVLEIPKNIWSRLIKNPTTIITNLIFLALLILFGLDAFHRTFN